MSTLSVVIATCNRAAVLGETLRCLERQTLAAREFEVVVVDDGSRDRTRAVVEVARRRAAFRMRYLQHANRGPGYSQNRGIRAARASLVLLLADDIHATPGLLESHLRAHRDYPEACFAVAGKVLQSPALPRGVFMSRWDPFRYAELEGRRELRYNIFRACNVSFKRELMLRFGMFIERPGAAHEDLEVGWRLYRDGGMRLLYREQALGHHFHPETIDSACGRAFERGANFDVLADNVPDPAIYVWNHIVSWRTLPAIRDRARGEHALIHGEDASPWWNVVRELPRRLTLLNRLTVPLFWLPAIRAAERHPMLAPLVTPLTLRGTVSHHFLLGLRALDRRRRANGRGH